MLKDQIALVTGSTSGIGLGIAEQLASAGVHVTLNGFADAALVAELRERLSGLSGARIDYDGADMRDPQAVRTMVAKVIASHGRLDILSTMPVSSTLHRLRISRSTNGTTSSRLICRRLSMPALLRFPL